MVFMPHWPKVIGKKPIDLKLERVSSLLKKLGNPHKKIAPVVHVAGTNGKGSTIAFLKAYLETSGYSVHSYTSPHLLNFNERITLAGEHISDDYLYEISEECRIVCNEEIPVTFFEATTVMAFLAFSRIEADIVLLETGLGGRLDATNIIDQPLATAITPISIDHKEYLGPTTDFIAREKAGIMKKNTPCIISLQEKKVYEILHNHADQVGCETSSFEYDWVVEKSETGFTYNNFNSKYEFPTPSLIGNHQIINAATAITIAHNLSNYNIPNKDIIAGLSSVKWPARLQKITQGNLLKLLPKNSELWVDGAHNDSGAFTISQEILSWEKLPLIIICGFTKGRDAKSFLKYFKDIADLVVTVTVRTEPSAQFSESIAQEAKEIDIEAKSFDSIEDIFNFLNKEYTSPIRTVSCGSLYLASDIFKINNTKIS